MKKNAVLVFSQNLIINSIANVKREVYDCQNIYLLTTHQMFDYEIVEVSKILEKNVKALTFIDFLTTDELVYCDQEAYKKENTDLKRYEDEIKRIKNELVVTKVEKCYSADVKLILCDDLGIDKSVWFKKEYRYVKCEYYHVPDRNSIMRRTKDFIKGVPFVKKYIENKNRKSAPIDEEVYVGYWHDTKYVFIGKMNRVGYRIEMDFVKSYEEAVRLHNKIFENKESCIYLTSLHESYRVSVPNLPQYAVYQIQDGYLPPIYSCYYKFIPDNHLYYAWDVMGERVFKSQNIPVKIMPFRKKIYLPEPKPVEEIKKVLIVASGSGDWTALKNRSDEDRMVQTFIAVAKQFPQITFVYRCHPVWVHPEHQGVHSIVRVAECLEKSGLGNIKISANIPKVHEQTFTVTYPRSSLEEDLRSADIVFGDHSVSMIDAAMQGILFASVNVMKRQNLFASVTELGFPHCISVDEICHLLNNIKTTEFMEGYFRAISNYNKMTDIED